MIEKNMDEYLSDRKRMVEEQIERRGITDPRVLKAFLEVPRHEFVPPEYGANAYEDHPLPIGYGQTISQPYMVALMTESLNLKKADKVLEIGTGSGYQAAILARICDRVYTIEREEKLIERTRKILNAQGYKNIEIRHGDGTEGAEDAAPFNGIIVTAAAPVIPEVFKKQLAAGGRLVIPVGTLYGQMLVVVERKDGGFTHTNICGCVFVPLVGKYGWPVEERGGLE